MSNKMFFQVRADKTPVGAWQNEDKRSTLKEIGDAEHIGMRVPEGFCVVDADSETAGMHITVFLSKMKIKPYSYKTTRGTHFWFKAPEGLESFNPLTSGTKCGAIPDLDYRANGKGYVVIKLNDWWRINPQELQKALKDPDLPVCPLVLITKPQLLMSVADYHAQGRDDWMIRFAGRATQFGWPMNLLAQLMAEFSVFAGDRESPYQTKQWIQQKLSSISKYNIVPTKQVSVEDFPFIKSETEIEAEEEKQTGIDPADLISSQEETSPRPKRTQKNKKPVKQEHTGTYLDAFKFDDDGKVVDVKFFPLASKPLFEDLQFTWCGNDRQLWGIDKTGLQVPIPDPDKVVGAYLYKTLFNVKPYVVGELTKAITYMAPVKWQIKNPYVISFKNMNWNPMDRETYTLKDGEMQTNQIPYVLISEEELKSSHARANETVQNFLHAWSVGDEEVKLEILEMFGYAMIKHSIDKAWFLVGEGSNGKSYVLDLLKNVLGQHNYNSEDLSKLSTNEFASAGLYGKLANINNDLSGGFIQDGSLFKRLASGDSITTSFKGKDSFTFNPYASMIFGSNGVPLIQDQAGSVGVMRRIKIIPFLNKFQASTANGKMKFELTNPEVCEVMILLAVRALEKSLIRGSLTTSIKAKTMLEDYYKELNHVITYVEQATINSGVQVYEVWLDYKEWCRKYGIRELSYEVFKKKTPNSLRSIGVDAWIEQMKVKGKPTDILFLQDAEE